METLGDALPEEMARIRDVVIPAYREIGSAASFALVFIRRDLDLAAKAMVEGDLSAMLTAYKALQQYKL